MGPDDELRQIFNEEASEFIEVLTQRLEQLSSSEGDTFDDLLKSTLRTTHNLKGAATTVGLEAVSATAHAVESVLGSLRGTSGPLPTDVSACIGDALKGIQAALDGFETEEQTAEILKRLAAFGGNVETKVPARQTDLKKAPSPAENLSDTHADGSIRVDTGRFDSLMNYLGEFLTFRARLEGWYGRQVDAFKNLSTVHSSDPDKYAELESLLGDFRHMLLAGRKGLLDFKNLTDEVTEAAKHLRTVPLKGAAHLWRRIVRETCRICNKDVSLEVAVGQVEIDRYVLERLYDPMMHLLRNAVDHGIEPPKERGAAGKTPGGNIRVSASLQGSMIRIEVSDDGRGIDWRKIRQKAVEKGMITAERAERLTDVQTADLLFRAGFSTAKEVGRISGRGVGLDVVREQVEFLGGSATMDATPALGGTTVVLGVPMSILSSSGLFVRCGGITYVFPIDSVRQSLRVSHDDLVTVDGHLVVKVGGADPVRAVLLGKIMGEQSSFSEDNRLKVVVLERSGLHLGVIVDEVLGHQEYVTHGLPWNFQHFPGISGAILEADGAVSILLDVMHLFDAAHKSEFAKRAASSSDEQRVLVVDDSMTSRTLQRAMLRAAGYDVTLAADGREAWQFLQKNPFDLLVSDIQMPRMDGIELTKKVRGASQLKDLPIILVTSLADPKDRAAGSEAGADDYLVKGTFDQQGLLEIVSKYLGKP